ncbi:MAG: phage holin [Christensenellales bacterium]
MKEKLKTTSFWLGLSGAVVIILESIAKIFDLNIASETVENIIISICSILVMLGIVTKKSVSDSSESSKDELLLELKVDENTKNDDKKDVD